MRRRPTAVRLSPGLTRRGVLAAALAGRAQAQTGPAAVPRFAVDLGGREDLRPWADAALAASRAWWPRIVESLPDPTFVPPDAVTLAVADLPDPNAPAATRGAVTVVSAAFLRAHRGEPDTVNLLAHELVHVVQRYPEPHSLWLTEGIADWVRYYVLLPHDPGRAFRAFTAPLSPGMWREDRYLAYRAGYQPAAALLDCCEHSRPGVVAAVHRAMRRGEDGPTLLERLAGARAERLWNACPAALHGARGG